MAYSGNDASKIMPLGGGDTLTIDMSQDAVREGQTDPNEVDKYMNRGIAVYTVSNPHAEVYLLDSNLVVGSASVSINSQRTLIEAGLLCDSKTAATEALGCTRSLQTERVTSLTTRNTQENH